MGVGVSGRGIMSGIGMAFFVLLFCLGGEGV